MRKWICLAFALTAVSMPALAGGFMIGGSGSPEIDANSVVTALSLLAGWAVIIRSRWSGKQTGVSTKPEETNGGGENSAD